MPEATPKIAVIVPVLNETGRCRRLIETLQGYRRWAQVIIVDGGSRDDTVKQLTQAELPLLQTESAGRSRQMNQGYRCLQADAYWFLHADCTPPDNAIQQIQDSLNQGHDWGRFDVRLSGAQPAFRIIERMMNWRSRLTRIATGDQGIFVRGALLSRIGGIPEIPIMEDIALSKALKKLGSHVCLPGPMRVSSRRWEKSGIIKMTLLMWWLRLRYRLGADPQDLYRSYYDRQN